MRFRKKIAPPIGDRKWVIRYLWLPLQIDGETRWLERAAIEYVYTKAARKVGRGTDASHWVDDWVPSRWGNDIRPGQNPFLPSDLPPPDMRH